MMKKSENWISSTSPLDRAHEWKSINKTASRFTDEFSRSLSLRGVNLCASSKLPRNFDRFESLNFYDHKNVSFVDRPFPLATADEHFSRLRGWGLTFIRILVPWEALEHSGAGKYDEDYIDYLIRLLKKAESYGIKCFIDPHQGNLDLNIISDTWSRFSGGSGAPGWTFEVMGLDLTKFKRTGSAFLHLLENDDGEGRGNIALWATNYTKLACATAMTLFFSGNVFAPGELYKGVPIQDFLQSAYFNCYAHLASRLKSSGINRLLIIEA
jgi:hypothetical protein